MVDKLLRVISIISAILYFISFMLILFNDFEPDKMYVCITTLLAIAFFLKE